MSRLALLLLPGLFAVLPLGAQTLTLPWRQIPVPHGGSFSGIVETAPGHVLAATDGTVYRSEDEGTTWHPTGLPAVSRLRFEGGEVLALSSPYPFTSTDLYRSADGGRSWRRHAFETGISDVRRTPQGRLFVVNKNEVLASLDDGVTWQQLLRRPSYRIQGRLSLTPEGWPFVGVGLSPVTDTLMAYNGMTWASTVLQRQYPLPLHWTDTFETPDGTQYFAVKGGVFRRDATAGWKRLVRRTAYTLAFREGRVLAGAADGIYGVEGDTGRVVATPAQVGSLSSGTKLWAATNWYVEGSLRTSVRPPDGAYRIGPTGEPNRLPVGLAVERVEAAVVAAGAIYVLGDGLRRLDPRTEQWTHLDPLNSVFDLKGEVYDSPLFLLASPDQRWLVLASGWGDEGGPPLYSFDIVRGRWAAVTTEGREAYGSVLGFTPQSALLFKHGRYTTAPLKRCATADAPACETVPPGGGLIGAVGSRLYALKDTTYQAPRRVIRSEDDGRTWKSTGGMVPGNPLSFAHMASTGEMVRWTPRTTPQFSTLVERSFDEGKTWQDSLRLEGAFLYDWQFSSGRRVLARATAGDRTFYLSEDLGRTWRRASAPAGEMGTYVLVGPNDELFAFGDHVWRTPWPTVTAVQEEATTASPLAVAPNPFHTSVTVTFTLAAPGPVRAEVFDALGRRVALLHDSSALSGPLVLRWEAGNASPGVYMLRVTMGGTMHTARLVRSR